MTTYYKEPRDNEDMSLNERIYVGAIENSSNNVFRGDKNDGVDEGAPDDDDDDHMFI